MLICTQAVVMDTHAIEANNVTLTDGFHSISLRDWEAIIHSLSLVILIYTRFCGSIKATVIFVFSACGCYRN
jgi:hypothetical protein